MAIPSANPEPVRLQRLEDPSAKDRGSLFLGGIGSCRISLNVSWIDSEKRDDLDAKVQEVWGAIRSFSFLGQGASEVKVNISKLTLSYKDASGTLQYVDLGANGGSQCSRIQDSIESLRSSLLAVYKNLNWGFDRNNPSSRPVRAERPFRSEFSPQRVVQSMGEFIQGGRVGSLDVCIQSSAETRSPLPPSTFDEDKKRWDSIRKRLHAVEVFIQDLQKAVEKLSDEKGPNSLGDVEGEIGQLKGLKQELAELDLYAVYWAAGLGPQGGDKETRFHLADTAASIISSDLQEGKKGLFKMQKWEPSAIEKYAQEIVGLRFCRIDYVERLERAGDRPARGSSLEGLVVLAAMNNFDSGQMKAVCGQAGLDRFGGGLLDPVTNASKSAAEVLFPQDTP